MIPIPPAWTAKQPVRWSKPRLILGFVIVGLVWHGLLADFRPAGWLYATPILAFFVIVGIATGSAAVYGNYRMGRFRGWRAVGQLFGALILVPIVAFLLWLIPAKSLGWFVTAAVGEPYARTMEGVVVHQWRRRKCDYFVDTQAKSGPFPRTYCVSKDYVLRYGGLRVRIRMVGDRSFMGTRYTGFEHLAVLEGPAATPP